MSISKKGMVFIALFCAMLHASGQAPAVAVIPEPVSVTYGQGNFILPSTVVIHAPAGVSGTPFLADFQAQLQKATGYKVSQTTAAGKRATITLKLNTAKDNKLGSEGYNLVVAGQGITITANQPAGLFYGTQTLLQLLPPQIESPTAVTQKWTVPQVQVTDYPRFGWRGLMLDVSRHFFTKAEVKQFIDMMVKSKYNLLHLHLVDDEGWRIEIKGLPNLTKKGAYRVTRTGYFNTLSPPTPDEPRDYGGFYTQEDIRELVKYAQDRFVNILPEIDVPGHSLAAVAAYPGLSCTPGTEKYEPRAGEPIMDWSHGAPPIALVDNTLCPANERVYGFLDTVMTQVAALFPFDYIHCGGDECPKNFWEKNDFIKALMQRENLTTMEEVQSYFEKRLEKIVESKGKRFLGWDEILEGGLAPNAVVMSWRGLKGGIEAAKMGHEVVMSPTDYVYLDYMNGDPAIEPKVYATLRLSKAYQFDPLPEGIDPKFIKGGQANLWTEQVYNMRHLEYMVYPRAWAIAEALWSPKDKKDWGNFSRKLPTSFARSDAADTKYAPSVYDPIINVKANADKSVSIRLSTEVDGLTIHYSFDNSFPDNHYPAYKEPLTIPKDASMLRMITYRGNKPVGRMVTITTDEIRQRAAKKQNFP